MALTFTVGGRLVGYRFATLCACGDHGDYHAQPVRAFPLDLAGLAEQLRRAGATELAVRREFLAARWRGATITVLDGGRILLEGIQPEGEQAALSLLRELLLLADAVAGARGVPAAR